MHPADQQSRGARDDDGKRHHQQADQDDAAIVRGRVPAVADQGNASEAEGQTEDQPCASIDRTCRGDIAVVVRQEEHYSRSPTYLAARTEVWATRPAAPAPPRVS